MDPFYKSMSNSNRIQKYRIVVLVFIFQGQKGREEGYILLYYNIGKIKKINTNAYRVIPQDGDLTPLYFINTFSTQVDAFF